MLWFFVWCADAPPIPVHDLWIVVTLNYRGGRFQNGRPFNVVHWGVKYLGYRRLKLIIKFTIAQAGNVFAELNISLRT